MVLPISGLCRRHHPVSVKERLEPNLYDSVLQFGEEWQVKHRSKTSGRRHQVQAFLTAAGQEPADKSLLETARDQRLLEQ